MEVRSRRVKKQYEPRLETGVRLDEPIVSVFADEGVDGNLLPGRLATAADEEDEFPLFAEEPIADGIARRKLTPDDPELFADEDAIVLNRPGPSRWLARRALALCTVIFLVLLALSRNSPPAVAPSSNAAVPSEAPARPSQKAPTIPAPAASPSVAPNQVTQVTEQPAATESLAPSTPEPMPPSPAVPAPSLRPPDLPALQPPGPITGLGDTTIRMAAPPRPLPASPAATSAMPVEPSASSELVDETAGVRDVLARYVEAYASLDARAVAAVWPTVNQAALGRAFEALEAQHITFNRCSVTVSGATARAMCAGRAAWTPKIGGRRPREDERTWTFALTHRNDSWAIVSAQMR